jgi:hypothetical protein
MKAQAWLAVLSLDSQIAASRNKQQTTTKEPVGPTEE